MKNALFFTVLIVALIPLQCRNPALIEEGFAEVNGTRLHYEIAGDGEAIVFIHGNFGDYRHWDDQIAALSKSNQVLRYDVRGYGQSAPPEEGEVYSHHVDLKALMEYHDIPEAHIAGFSMGCGLAVDFVLAFPEMSKSLIAVGPWVAGFNAPSAQEIFDDFREVSSLLAEEGTEAAKESLFDLHYLKPANPHRLAGEKMKQIISDFTFWTFSHENPVRRLQPPAIQQLDSITIPTLIITSDYDVEACKEVADLLERTIPGAIKVIIENASHIMMMEQPDAFNESIIQFIKQMNAE